MLTLHFFYTMLMSTFFSVCFIKTMERENTVPFSLLAGDSSIFVPDPINQGDLQGNRPLHFAVMDGDAETVEMLLQNGAAVDARTAQAETPVHMAAMLGHANILHLLLEKAKDNLHVRNLQGQTPLQLPCLIRMRIVFDYLYREGLVSKKLIVVR